MTKETNSGAVAPIEDEKLDHVAAATGSGAGKVGMNDVRGDPSQWGVAVYKKGSFDITD